MQVSCVQSNPQENLEENIEFISRQLEKAKSLGSEVVVLPEVFFCMGSDEKRRTTKSTLHEGVFLEIEKKAKELGIYIVAGSHGESIPNNAEKIFNTSVTYGPHGEKISVYRKLHLFHLKDGEGNKLYSESDVFEHGEAPKSYPILCGQESWKACTIICYDLRFPEIIRNQKEPIDILFVPAAFIWQTGQSHWEVLLRARAIENQCYVVACNQTGFYFDNKKRNYGHSMIIDPWGNVEASLGEEVGLLTATLSKKKIEDSRSCLPALSDRRLFS